MQDGYWSTSISEKGRCSVVERTRNQKCLVNGIRQRVLDFVPVKRYNTVEGQGRLHVRLSKLSLTLNVRASVVKH